MDELLAICQALDIDIAELNKAFTIWRFDTLNVRGVDQLTSEDIYNYFGPIHPHSIEWLSNISCNVTFDSSAQACNALQAVAIGVIIHKNQNPESVTIKSSDDIPMDLTVISSDALEIPVPPNYRYILGTENPKAKSIIIRFATINDKKIVSTAEPEKPPGLVRSLTSKSAAMAAALRDNDNRNAFRRGGRPEREAHIHRSFTSSRVNSSVPRMRMRADEEEKELMEHRKQQRKMPKSLASRLGNGVHLSTNGRRDRDSDESSSVHPRFRLGISSRLGSGGQQGGNPSSIVKSKNHIWRRSFGSGAVSGITSRNDLRERLASRDAMVRVRVSYDEDAMMD